ncbi:hypothetical protein GC194_06980 [bacterium]|nr:hypothetical protein [bacterium]
MIFGKQKDIPNIFYDTVNEAPITHCKFCEKELLVGKEPYVIEKSFRRKETINEYASCMTCAEKMQARMSKESKKAIEEYMLQHADFENRYRQVAQIEHKKQQLHQQIDFVDEEETDIAKMAAIEAELQACEKELENLYDEWFNTCLIKGSKRSDEEEYVVQGMFVGNKMLESHMYPHMLGAAAMEEIQELLSAETREEMDRIKDEFFVVPPEFADLFRDPKFTLVF